MKLKTLSKSEVSKFLKKNPEWKLNASSTALSQTIQFESHVDALVFIARVTVHAEILQHHPDITYTYRKVKVVISTHEIKSLTKLDTELAERITKLLSSG